MRVTQPAIGCGRRYSQERAPILEGQEFAHSR
jgi:hypothetical protein